MFIYLVLQLNVSIFLIRLVLFYSPLLIISVFDILYISFNFNFKS